MEKITTKQAIETLCKALRTDKGYRESWVANIAMSMHDEYTTRWPGLNDDEYKIMHKVCNDGAERFLNLLTSKVEE